MKFSTPRCSQQYCTQEAALAPSSRRDRGLEVRWRWAGVLAMLWDSQGSCFWQGRAGKDPSGLSVRATPWHRRASGRGCPTPTPSRGPVGPQHVPHQG